MASMARSPASCATAMLGAGCRCGDTVRPSSRNRYCAAHSAISAASSVGSRCGQRSSHSSIADRIGTRTCREYSSATLVGEAFYERLSNSNLSNAGLGELCTTTVDHYVATAVALAADRTLRRGLRQTMRARLKAHPLGRPDLFVADFAYALAAWLDEEPR